MSEVTHRPPLLLGFPHLASPLLTLYGSRLLLQFIEEPLGLFVQLASLCMGHSLTLHTLHISSHPHNVSYAY